MKRSREDEYDYSSFVQFLEAINDTRFPREIMERMVDVDMMAANAVVRGWADDWDNITRNRGKNGYQVRRYSDGKWMLIQWDSDLTFGNSGAPFVGGLVRGFFGTINASAAQRSRFFFVKRKFNYYLGEMLDKYTHDSPRLATWLELEERTSTEYSTTTSSYRNWNSSRRSRAQTEIGAAFTTTFRVSGSSTTSADTINLTGSAGYKIYTIRSLITRRRNLVSLERRSGRWEESSFGKESMNSPLRPSIFRAMWWTATPSRPPRRGTHVP